MKRPVPNSEQLAENQFVIDLLTTLQRERYSIVAWRRFLWRSWLMSCETANTHPSLKRSWRLTTLAMAVLVLALCSITLQVEGPGIMLRLLPGFCFCVAWQQSDLFWHLGMIRNNHTGQLYTRVGWANFLTLLRGLGAGYLLGRIIGGIQTPAWLALTCFIIGVSTDILDGIVARETGTQSKWGQIADGEADFCLYTAMSSILVQNALLPVWLGIVMIARFLLPLLGASISYFLLARPLHFGSTRWGKFAGLFQCIYFFVLLMPSPFFPITHLVMLPLLIITLTLLLIAPVAQVRASGIT